MSPPAPSKQRSSGLTLRPLEIESLFVTELAAFGDEGDSLAATLALRLPAVKVQAWPLLTCGALPLSPKDAEALQAADAWVATSQQALRALANQLPRLGLAPRDRPLLVVGERTGKVAQELGFDVAFTPLPTAQGALAMAKQWQEQQAHPRPQRLLFLERPDGLQVAQRYLKEQGHLVEGARVYQVAPNEAFEAEQAKAALHATPSAAILVTSPALARQADALGLLEARLPWLALGASTAKALAALTTNQARILTATTPTPAGIREALATLL